MDFIHISNIEHLLKKKNCSNEENIVLLAQYESIGGEDRIFSLNFSFVEEPDKKLRCYFDVAEGRNQPFIEIMRVANCYHDGWFRVEKLHDYLFEVHIKYDKFLKTYYADKIKICVNDNSKEDRSDDNFKM